MECGPNLTIGLNLTTKIWKKNKTQMLSKRILPHIKKKKFLFDIINKN